MKKPYLHKRVLAYLLDLLIVTVISTLITYFIPQNVEYKEAINELKEVDKAYADEQIEIEEYKQSLEEINYKLSKSCVDVTIITITVSLLYFVLFNYYSNGKTIGKRLMNLQIVGINNKNVTINNYLVRTLFVNSSFSNILSVILILSLNESMYIKYNNYVSTIFSYLLLGTFACMAYRNDGRGIHDILAKTIVVDTKNTITNDVVEEKKEKEKEKTIDVTAIEKNEVVNTISKKEKESKNKKKTKNESIKSRKESIKNERV